MNNRYIIKTGIGMLEITETERGIASLDFCGAQKESENLSKLADRLRQEIDAYTNGLRKDFDLPLDLSGTPFQQKVWQALRKIPYGETVTYKQIAEEIGSPKAFRAVGSACNRNPVCVLVPCHRVVGSNGDLTGYAGGLDKKEMLLAIEERNRHV